MRTPNALEYRKAAEREIQAFIDNDVFELVPLESAKGNTILSGNWVIGRKWDGTAKG
jgi:hypothetical protein